jgi:nitrogen fixation protein NifX
MMRIGFATTDGIYVDEHFGRAGKFAIYEVDENSYSLYEMRIFGDCRDLKVELTKNMGEVHEEAVDLKVKKLTDCSVIYMTEIGGPAAARLVKNGIMPIKVKDGTSINELLEKFLDTMKNSPPPWMKKILNKNKKEEIL